MTATQEQLEDWKDEERKMDQKDVNSSIMKQIDREIEMFNDISALFGYVRS